MASNRTGMKIVEQVSCGLSIPLWSGAETLRNDRHERFPQVATGSAATGQTANNFFTGQRT